MNAAHNATQGTIQTGTNAARMKEGRGMHRTTHKAWTLQHAVKAWAAAVTWLIMSCFCKNAPKMLLDCAIHCAINAPNVLNNVVKRASPSGISCDSNDNYDASKFVEADARPKAGNTVWQCICWVGGVLIATFTRRQRCTPYGKREGKGNGARTKGEKRALRLLIQRRWIQKRIKIWTQTRKLKYEGKMCRKYRNK
eukprot:4115327-Pleurochrysis_carterae.AAC.1